VRGAWGQAELGCLRLTRFARDADAAARPFGRGACGGTPSNGRTDPEQPTPGEFEAAGPGGRPAEDVTA